MKLLLIRGFSASLQVKLEVRGRQGTPYSRKEWCAVHWKKERSIFECKKSAQENDSKGPKKESISGIQKSVQTNQKTRVKLGGQMQISNQGVSGSGLPRVAKLYPV
ncbi:MAG: hypothetical protein DMG49_14065 [Acidobacteria bacterium]|nr:MAG: hypothetical protein DMG49_14065 [Acidobacteriota bacterium]